MYNLFVKSLFLKSLINVLTVQNLINCIRVSSDCVIQASLSNTVLIHELYIIQTRFLISFCHHQNEGLQSNSHKLRLFLHYTALLTNGDGRHGGEFAFGVQSHCPAAECLVGFVSARKRLINCTLLKSCTQQSGTQAH